MLRLNSTERLGAEGRLTAPITSAATKQAEVVVLTVPFAAHEATLESIKPGLSGQILIDTTVPLVPPRVAVVQLPEARERRGYHSQYPGRQGAGDGGVSQRGRQPVGTRR